MANTPPITPPAIAPTLGPEPLETATGVAVVIPTDEVTHIECAHCSHDLGTKEQTWPVGQLGGQEGGTVYGAHSTQISRRRKWRSLYETINH